MIKQGTWYGTTLAVYYYDHDPADTRTGSGANRKRVAVHGVFVSEGVAAGVRIAFEPTPAALVWSDPDRPGFAARFEFGNDTDAGDSVRHLAGRELLGKRAELGVVAPGAYGT